MVLPGAPRGLPWGPGSDDRESRGAAALGSWRAPRRGSPGPPGGPLHRGRSGAPGGPAALPCHGPELEDCEVSGLTPRETSSMAEFYIIASLVISPKRPGTGGRSPQFHFLLILQSKLRSVPARFSSLLSSRDLFPR